MIATLRPKGRLHVMGAVLEPIPVNAFDIIMTPMEHFRLTERFPPYHGSHARVLRASQYPAADRAFPARWVNDAIAHLLAGKARYRLVLDR